MALTVRVAERLRAVALPALAIGLALSISLSEISLLVLLVAVVLERGRGPWRLPLGVPIAAFLGWTAVTMLASPHPVTSLWEGKASVWLLTVPVVANAVRDRSEAHRWVRWLFLCIAAASVLAIVQVAACPATTPPVPLLDGFLRKCSRARSFFSIYMTLGGVLTVALITTLPGVVRSWGGPKRPPIPSGARRRPGKPGTAFDVAAWLAGVVALALTYVRGAWIGFAIGAVASLTIERRRRVVLIAVATILLAVVALPGVLTRARTIGDPTDPTTRDRLAMLHGGLAMVRGHWWLGVGPGGVKRLYPVYAPPEALRRSTSHLHDTPLQILVERGIVGLGLWLGLFGAFLVRATRVLHALPASAEDDRALVVGARAAIVAFVVAGLFEYNFGDTEVLLIASAVMALPFVVEADARAGAAGVAA